MPTLVGNTDFTESGRSMGGAALNPHDAAPDTMLDAPIVSAPICANAELHDTRRISGSVPPHVSPPKFLIGLFVCAGVYPVVNGYDGSVLVTRPVCRPMPAVTTLNVEPGK